MMLTLQKINLEHPITSLSLVGNLLNVVLLSATEQNSKLDSLEYLFSSVK
jgi:hypothetical protein